MKWIFCFMLSLSPVLLLAQKVNICHNGNQLCVGISAVQAHLNHGDNLGTCSSNKTAETWQEGEKSSSVLNIFPNPFSGNTSIRITLPVDQQVRLDIYNPAGIHIQTLFNGKAEGGKTYSFPFGNAQLSSGIYMCRMISSMATEYRKIILVK